MLASALVGILPARADSHYEGLQLGPERPGAAQASGHLEPAALEGRRQRPHERRRFGTRHMSPSKVVSRPPVMVTATGSMSCRCVGVGAFLVAGESVEYLE